MERTLPCVDSIPKSPLIMKDGLSGNLEAEFLVLILKVCQRLWD